jgi:hypothetical protein
MRMTTKTLGAITMAALLGGALVGCKGADSGRKQRTVKATIGTFDPNADIELDMNGGGGGERPDDYDIQMAFNQTFGGMDECVSSAKDRKGVKKEKALPGTIDVAVKLNPGSHRPLGVNATISGRHGKDPQLVDCVREAVAAAPFPKYDGPPIVAEFQTELDPGTDWEED